MNTRPEPGSSPAAGRSVSAVVPHFGDPAVAREAVADLLAQEGPHRVEVIVVDDCSPQPFPDLAEVVTVRRAVNGGFGAAVNSGVAVATGDLLMIVNSDVRLAADLTDQLVRESALFMPAVVGPVTTTLGGDDEPTGRRFPTAAHWVLEGLVGLQPFATTRWFQRAIGRVSHSGTGAVEVDWLQGSLLLLPTDAFRAVGGFDERFYLYSEEVDLQRRLRARGLKSWLLPAVEVRHVGGASTDSGRSNDWLTRSRITYADKWGGLRRLRAAMRAMAVVNLAMRIALRLAGRRTAPRVGWTREMQAARTPPWPRPPGNAAPPTTDLSSGPRA